MLDLTTIILTKNEEKHIVRCLDRLHGVGKRIIVVDSGSDDNTCALAMEHGAEVVKHDWPGNQAAQFNWAIDNLTIGTEWVLRLDADEYLSDDLKSELSDLLPGLQPPVNALLLPLGRCFMGRRLRHGIVNGVSMIRIFRHGKARYESRLMDEHIELLEGEIYVCHHEFIDDNKSSLTSFIEKHNGYATREALVLLTEEDAKSYENGKMDKLAEAVQAKRLKKQRYARMPLFFRSIGYFAYRYIFKMGFLDGREGFLWDFFQGLWYRTLVDAKVLEIKRACGNDRDKIRELIRSEYNIEI